MSLVSKFNTSFAKQITDYIKKYAIPELESDVAGNSINYDGKSSITFKPEDLNRILTELEKLKVKNVNLVLPEKEARGKYRINPSKIPKNPHGKIQVQIYKKSNIVNRVAPYTVQVISRMSTDPIRGGKEYIHFSLDFLIVADSVSAVTPPSPAPAAARVSVPIAPSPSPPKPSGIDPCTIPKGYLCKLEGNKYVCTRMGGGSNGYEAKYLKYKAKYLQLKNQLNL
jgi:hypothetical protein